MQITTTNSFGETRIDEVSELPNEIHTSGYINVDYDEKDLDSPETLEAVEQLITKNIEEKTEIPLNRAQRRALMKKAGKKGRAQLSTIGETAKKLNYIDLIQKLKQLNAEKENENGTIKNN